MGIYHRMYSGTLFPEMCIRDSDIPFGDGKHWNDSETAFGNAYKGRTLLCMWCMGCYIDSRNGSNLFSLSVNELPWSCVFNSTDANPAGSAGKFSDRCFSSCIYMDGFGKKWYGC